MRRYRVVRLCFLAAFVCYIDRVNISVAALTMQERFRLVDDHKGWVLSSFFAGYLAFQIPGGWLANRLGGKWVLGAAVLWWSLCTLQPSGSPRVAAAADRRSRGDGLGRRGYVSEA